MNLAIYEGASDWTAASVGAASAILAAILTVWLAHWLTGRSQEKTLRDLIGRMKAASERMHRDVALRPAEAVRDAGRAFRATRDVAVGLRTNNARIATIAARMEYTTVWKEFERLLNAGGGVNAADGQARAEEMKQLAIDMLEVLDGKA